MADKKVTIAEVKKHSSEDDCWIIIHGKVYDVTKFIDSHPGGDILIDVAGRDASTDFDDIGHSEGALEMMKEFLVGVLA